MGYDFINMKAGAKINIQDKKGRTPLHETCARGDKLSTSLLLNHKKEKVLLNTLAKNGASPLDEALTNHHNDIAKELVMKGAVVGRSDVMDRSEPSVPSKMQSSLSSHVVNLNMQPMQQPSGSWGQPQNVQPIMQPLAMDQNVNYANVNSVQMTPYMIQQQLMNSGGSGGSMYGQNVQGQGVQYQGQIQGGQYDQPQMNSNIHYAQPITNVMQPFQNPHYQSMNYAQQNSVQWNGSSPQNGTQPSPTQQNTQGSSSNMNQVNQVDFTRD